MSVLHMNINDLTREKLFFITALDGIKTAVIITDRNNRISLMNAYSKKLLECDDEEVVGTSLPSVVKYITEFDSTSGYKILQTRKGRKIHIEESLIPVKDEQGHNQGSVLIFKEISLDDIHSLSIPLKIDHDEFKTLLYSLVHEINNILSVIVSNTEVLEIYTSKLRKSVPSKHDFFGHQEIIDFISKTEDILKDNTESLTVLTEILENANEFLLKESYNFQEIKLKSIVEEVVEFLFSILNISIEITINIEDEIKIEFNRTHLSIILRNVILNAFQACINTIEKRVRISGFQKKGELTIIIEDTGTGIPDELIPRLFDPYFTTKDIHLTDGLGLTICKDIVNHNNGSIKIDSKLNHGTKVEIKLPVNRTKAR